MNPFDSTRHGAGSELDQQFRIEALKATLITVGIATLPFLLAVLAICWTRWAALLVLGVGGLAWARGDAVHREWGDHMPSWGLWTIRGLSIASVLLGLALITGLIVLVYL